MSAEVTPIDYASPLKTAPPVALPWPVAGVCLVFGALGLFHLGSDLFYLLADGDIDRTSFAFVLDMLPSRAVIAFEWFLLRLAWGLRPWLYVVMLLPLLKRSAEPSDRAYRRRYFRIAGFGLLVAAVIEPGTQIALLIAENDFRWGHLLSLSSAALNRLGGAVGVLLLACCGDDFHRRGRTARRVMAVLISLWSAAAVGEIIVKSRATSVEDFWHSWWESLKFWPYFFDFTLLPLLGPVFFVIGIVIYAGVANWRMWMRTLAWAWLLLGVAGLVHLMWGLPDAWRSFDKRDFLEYVATSLPAASLPLVLAILARWVADAPRIESP